MQRLTIHFFDSITTTNVNLLIEKITEAVQEHKPETLYFLVSSYGGCPKAGLVLFNFLNSLPLELITHCTGVLHSASVVPFLAGVKRRAYPYSQFLVHRVHSTNTASRNALQVAEQLRMVESDDVSSIAIMHLRTEMPIDELQKIYLNGHVFDNAYAEANGFIHETTDYVPVMSDVIVFRSPKE